MLRRLRPIEFRLARTAAKLEAAYRLRYRIVTERGWQPPVPLENGLEREAIDDRALHMIGWQDDQAVANFRITCPDPDHLLPMEQLLGFRVQPAGEVVQGDRICVDRAHSGGRSELLLGLLCASWQQIQQLGYRYVAGFDSASILRIYRRYGLEPTLLGEARLYWGEERYPTLFQPLTVDERFFERVYADR